MVLKISGHVSVRFAIVGTIGMIEIGVSLKSTHLVVPLYKEVRIGIA